MYRRFLLLALVVLLSGCAPHFTYQPYAKRQQALKQLTHWQLRGSVRVQYQGKVQTAFVSWQQQGEHDLVLRLSGPVGIAAVVFKETPGGVTFQRGDQLLKAASLQSMMKQELGWSLPADNFYYWVRGLAAPGLGKASRRFDQFGHLIYMKQGQWSLRFDNYHPEGRVDLPRDIQLWSSRLQLHLAVSAWTLKQAAKPMVSNTDLDLLKSVS